MQSLVCAVYVMNDCCHGIACTTQKSALLFPFKFLELIHTIFARHAVEVVNNYNNGTKPAAVIKQ